MSIFSWLSRPAWQSRDASRRVDAVSSGRQPELLAELPQILRGDPDLRVRRAALERIDDLTLIADRMSNDIEASMRERARTRLLDLLTGGGAPLAERLRALGLVEEPAMLEHVARRAPEAELRRAALERCKRQGFLAERLVEDSDVELRLALLARIEQPATLERVAQQARTRDKRLYRAIRERLDAGQLEAGAQDALLARAQALCIAIEQRLKHPGADAIAQLEAAEREYASLRVRIDERFDARFNGALSMLRGALAAIARIGEVAAVQEPAPQQTPTSVDAAQVDAVPAAPATAAEPAGPDSALVALLQHAEAMSENAAPTDIDTLERRWQSVFARNSPRPQADLELAVTLEARLHALREAGAARASAAEHARTAAEAAIGALQAAVDENQLLAARAARAQARATIDAMPETQARTFARRLAGFDARIEKLAQWQRWSDNKVRVRLCEEAEALIGSGLHPDGLANKVAELKAAWKRIDDSEADPAAPIAESGLARRFRFLCHKALEPARGYFEKRKEVRGKRSEETGAFLDRARSEIAATDTDVAGLLLIKRDAGDRLRRVDEMDPRQRGEIGRQLKQLIEACSAQIDARFAGIAEEKHKLIAQLRRQLAHAELDDALDLAKAAQKRWKGLGKGSQKTDQALWQEFRALIDPLFARRNDEIKAVDDARSAEREAAQKLIDELQQLESRQLDSAHTEAEIVRIDEGWRVEARPRELERAWDAALAKAHALVGRLRADETRAGEQAVLALAAEIDTLEARWMAGEPIEPDTLMARAQALESRHAQALAQRLARLSGDQDRAEVAAAQVGPGERLALEYEYLAGIESPGGEQQARLNLRLEKLAARMQTGQVADPVAERAALDLRWWALGPLDPHVRRILTERRARALQTLG